MIKVKFKDKVLEVDKGVRVKDILQNEIKAEEALACMCNNEVMSLNNILEEDCEIRLINYSDKDGKRIYNRGIIYIMTKALQEVYPKALLTVNYQLGSAMFCEIDNMEVTDEFIQNIKNRMREITNSDFPIEKTTMTRLEAEKFYEEHKTLKGILQLDVKERDKVSLYYCDGFFNYLYGVLPISTGVIKTYDVHKYQDGFLVLFPELNTDKKITEYKESKKLFKTLEEYEDLHKILGVQRIYKLNKRIRENRIDEYILLDEALHEKKIANIADCIVKRKDVKVVLIAGPSSSGKTTFAQRLGIQMRLNGLKPVTISVDNYFVEREDTPKDEHGNYDFESIDAIDLELFNTHLKRLLNGEEINMPTFNFAVGRKEYNGKKLKLEDDNVLVIEGIHCLNDRLTYDIPKEQKFKVYVSALTVLNIDYHNRISTTDTRLIRRIVRDNQFRGYSALHTLKMWYSVNRGERKHIFPYQEEADAMFNSSLIYELAVLKDYAIPLLKEINNSVPEYSEARRLLTMLSFFESIKTDVIPKTSLLREFIGGSAFKE